jgi:hypothetical protein
VERPTEELPESLPYRNHVSQTLAHARNHDAGAFFRSRLSDIDAPTAPFGLLDVLGGATRIEQARRLLDSGLRTRNGCRSTVRIGTVTYRGCLVDDCVCARDAQASGVG